jgi:hypothetical protein
MDTGLSAGTNYSFGVSAVSSGGESLKATASATAANWTKVFGSMGADDANADVIDSSGNLYVTGYTMGKIGSNAGNPSGYSDFYVAKYNSSGLRQWAQQFGGSNGYSYADGIAVDGSGNVYVAGITQTDLGGTNAGGYDIFIAKFDTSGNKVWLKQIGTPGDEVASGIAVDASGNAYVTGWTTGSLGGASLGGYDIFIAKFDTSGNQAWIQQIGTPYNEEATGIAVDALGNAYITGWTSGNFGVANFGIADVFIAKYDTSGNQAWLKQIGTGDKDEAFGIAVDAAGNAYITGFTYGNLGNQTPAPTGSIFVGKFDTSGTQQWVKVFGSGGNEQGNAIAVDASGNSYITGYASGGISGRPYAGGPLDVFAAKYDASGNQKWVKEFGSADEDVGHAVAIDAVGNAFVVGYTKASLDGQSTFGAEDAFISKFASDGTQW